MQYTLQEPIFKIIPTDPLTNTVLTATCTTPTGLIIPFRCSWKRINHKKTQIVEFPSLKNSQTYRCTPLDLDCIIEATIQPQASEKVRTVQTSLVQLNKELIESKTQAKESILCKIFLEESSIPVKVLVKTNYLVVIATTFIAQPILSISLQDLIVDPDNTNTTVFRLTLKHKFEDFLFFFQEAYGRQTLLKPLAKHFTFVFNQGQRDIILLFISEVLLNEKPPQFPINSAGKSKPVSGGNIPHVYTSPNPQRSGNNSKLESYPNETSREVLSFSKYMSNGQESSQFRKINTPNLAMLNIKKDLIDQAINSKIYQPNNPSASSIVYQERTKPSADDKFGEKSNMKKSATTIKRYESNTYRQKECLNIFEEEENQAKVASQINQNVSFFNLHQPQSEDISSLNLRKSFDQLQINGLEEEKNKRTSGKKANTVQNSHKEMKDFQKQSLELKRENVEMSALKRENQELKKKNADLIEKFKNLLQDFRKLEQEKKSLLTDKLRIEVLLHKQTEEKQILRKEKEAKFKQIQFNRTNVYANDSFAKLQENMIQTRLEKQLQLPNLLSHRDIN